MTNMFTSCDKLETIYVGENWSVENIEEETQMFRYCTKLVGQNGTTYDADAFTEVFAVVDTAVYDEFGNVIEGQKGYLSLKN